MHMRVLQHLGILALGFSLTINKKTHKKSQSFQENHSKWVHLTHYLGLGI